MESRTQLAAGTMSKYKHKRKSGSGGARSMHYHRKEHVENAGTFSDVAGARMSPNLGNRRSKSEQLWI